MATAAAKKAALVSSKMERHPLSERYGPDMTTEELDALTDDIKSHGQHDDIILFEGKVLAGWNRYLACQRAGKAPRFKEMEEGADPVQVAFGTNFMRRRLSSVQKALFGAYLVVDTKIPQTAAAKKVGCNMNRLNQCVQLIKRAEDDKDAAKQLENIRTNTDLSGGTFDEIMMELGIKEAAKPSAPLRTGTHADDDLSDFDTEDDDLTGGAIDALIGSDPEGEEHEAEAAAGGDKPSRKSRGEIGEGSAPLPAVGGKRDSLTRPEESLFSRVAGAFRKLSADEQRRFVKAAWGKLHVALNAAIVAGDVEYTPPTSETSPGTQLMEGGRKAKADKAAAKKAGKAPAPGDGKPDPSIIARGKTAGHDMPDGDEEDDLLAGKSAVKPGSEVGSPFKESAHEEKPTKAAAKKAPAKAAAKAPAKKAAAKAPAKAAKKASKK